MLPLTARAEQTQSPTRYIVQCAYEGRKISSIVIIIDDKVQLESPKSVAEMRSNPKSRGPETPTLNLGECRSLQGGVVCSYHQKRMFHCVPL